MSVGLLFVMSFFDGNEPAVGESKYDVDNLHVTLLPESTIPDSMLEAFIESIEEYSKTVEQFKISEIGATVYGNNSLKVPVVLIEPSAAIVNVHLKLLELLTSFGGAPVKPYVGKNFSPHISFKEYVPNQAHTVTGLSIVYHRGGLGVDVHNLGNYKFEG